MREGISLEYTMSTHLITYTEPAAGVRSGTGAGGFSAVRLTPEFLASLADDERELLASSVYLTDDPERALESARENKRRYNAHVSGFRTDGTDPASLQAALRRVLTSTAEERRQNAALAEKNANEIRTWLAGDRSTYCPSSAHDSLLKSHGYGELLAEWAAAEGERKRVARQVACRQWATGLSAEFRSLPEVAAAVDAHDPGEQYSGPYQTSPWQAANAAVQRALEAHARASAEVEAAARRQWVAEHGSEHLRSLADLGLAYGPLYESERLALERPGWQWEPSEWDGRTPIAPPPEAVALLQEARKTVPEAELLFLRPLDEDEDDAPRRFFCRAEFLGRTIAFGPVPPIE